MSLKFFHVFFIIVSILFSGWFGVFSWEAWRATGGGSSLALTVVGFAATAGLAVYLLVFLRKLRNPDLWSAPVTPAVKSRNALPPR